MGEHLITSKMLETPPDAAEGYTMGLDLVELLIAVETAFDLTISDDQAGDLTTPRVLITYLASCVHQTDTRVPQCLTQRAFYRLRATCQQQLGLARSRLRPDTMVVSILPSHARKDHWRSIQDQLGATTWPHLRQNPVLIALRGADPLTLGQTAQYLVQWHPALLKDTDEGWTLEEIERTVITILEGLLGIDMKTYALDSHFVTDMLLD